MVWNLIEKNTGEGVELISVKNWSGNGSIRRHGARRVALDSVAVLYACKLRGERERERVGSGRA